MTLEKQDAELFYQLWFPLLDFVNQKYRVCPGTGTIKDMIISDGLVTAYPFCFGRGYSEAFKDIYRKAKENKTIRFSLSGGEPERRPNKEKETGTVESYVIKVSLGRSCYRYIQIGKQKTLGALSEAILAAFKFDDDHCHAFFMDDRYWSSFNAYYSDDMDFAKELW